MSTMFLTVMLLTVSQQVYGANPSFLSVHGNHFQLNGERVFLSGANQAWVSYGYDFGNRNYQWRGKDLERYLKELHQAGGNSLRIWIHIEGAVTPNFNANGYVTAPDKEGTFLNEMKTYLRKAQEYNILVFFCLWNGALAKPEDHYKLDGLIKDTRKLQSYIDKALVPWVNAVKGFPSLGGWDIMNAPEGQIIPDVQNGEPCFTTRSLKNTGAGWAGKTYTAQQLLRFINWQADAIHRADPKSLVSVGTWNIQSNTDRMGKVDFYKDSCLIKAGGKAKGTLDFVQTHTYSWQGSYDSYSPFKHVASGYGHSKPIVIGEFNQVSGAGMDITRQFAWAYNKGYSGAWTWHARADGSNTDTWANQQRGIRSVKGKNDQSKGGRVHITLPQPIFQTPAANPSFLSVHGNHFQLNGERVFLSGANQAWVSYGYDFGNRNYQWRGPQLERYLKELQQAGGNSLRIWIHIEGAVTPNFDGNGYVTAPDKEGTFLNEMKTYLRKAQEYNILVFFCLWNGALVKPEDHYKLDGLIKDTRKLQSYIDKALIPWVNAVKGFRSLGGWDIINEPEGQIIPDVQNSEPCFDTRSLKNTGAGFEARTYTAQQLLRFINWQADAIHRADPKSLVSVGTWNVQSNTDAMGKVDFYKDSCLIIAGGRAKGTLDFVQTHSYSHQGSYDSYAPFKHVASDYGHSKPIVIGEFNQVKGAGMDIVDQFAWAYNKGYSGAWTWHARADGSDTDTWANQQRGIRSVKGKNDQSKGGRVHITL